MVGLQVDPHNPQDDQQRLATAAQEFLKAGAGVGVEGVRSILRQEEPVAPEPPSHLLARGASTVLPCYLLDLPRALQPPLLLRSSSVPPDVQG